MVGFQVVIQHTIQRDDDAVYLRMLEDLAGYGVRPVIVTDTRPQADYDATWRTYAECLQVPPVDGETHRLILQDDVEFCGHFMEHLLAATTARPDHLLALFASHRPATVPAAMRRAYRSRWSWAVHPLGAWVPAQALVWPVGLMPRMLAYDDPYRGPWVADDERIARWARAEGEQVLLSVPSLVEHAGALTSTLHEQEKTAHTDRAGEHRLGVCVMRPTDRRWTPPRQLGESDVSYRGRVARRSALPLDWSPDAPVDWTRGPGATPDPRVRSRVF